MALTLGTHLGVYDIIAPTGAGSMGQVFPARDTKLERDVAIKILTDAFAHDADRLAPLVCLSPEMQVLGGVWSAARGQGVRTERRLIA